MIKNSNKNNVVKGNGIISSNLYSFVAYIYYDMVYNDIESTLE